MGGGCPDQDNLPPPPISITFDQQFLFKMQDMQVFLKLYKSARKHLAWKIELQDMDHRK